MLEKLNEIIKNPKSVSIKEVELLLINIDNLLIENNDIEKNLILSLELIENFKSTNTYLNLPKNIQILSNSYELFHALNVYLDQIYLLDILVESEFKKICLNYFNFLDSDLNNLFIIKLPKKIDEFNNKLNTYLTKKDFNNNLFKDNMEDLELIKRIEYLKNSNKKITSI